MPASKRLRSVVVLPLMVLGLLFATFSTATPEAQALTRAQKISNGLSVARNQIGDPYRYGAAGAERLRLLRPAVLQLPPRRLHQLPAHLGRAVPLRAPHREVQPAPG